ncbi:MAG: Gfo/Idh/MocA family oxidoreductase [Natronomonas sp.]
MRFGVLSTAKIGREHVIPAIQKTEHTVQAIGSRNIDRAEAVAAELDVPDAYGSYEAVLSADDVDVVYNPLPNSMHAEWSKRAADHGLDVLCEKPLAADAAETREVIEHCRDRGVTLMEAFMYRYHPRNERARTLAREELTDVHHVSGTLKFSLDDPEDVRLDPDLAGGSLLDVGCYPVSTARWILGEPDRVYARSHDARDCGVDTRMSGTLEYDSGAVAQFDCSFDTESIQRYRIEGRNGWIEAEREVAYNAPPERSTTLEYRIDGQHGVETFEAVDQYRLEVEHFIECVRNRTTPRTGPQEALDNMRVLDALYSSADAGTPVDIE